MPEVRDSGRERCSRAATAPPEDIFGSLLPSASARRDEGECSRVFNGGATQPGTKSTGDIVEESPFQGASNHAGR
jgi:hypothetical protein